MKIHSVLSEKRLFPPSQEFAARANVGPEEAARLRALAEKEPDAFWAEAARLIDWERPFSQVSSWEEPFAKFFLGGRLNVAYNCVDRHLAGARRHKAAIVWEGEPGEIRVLTYQQLHREVCRLANALVQLGIKAGTGSPSTSR
jgi:acetyl-CoA synthetase